MNLPTEKSWDSFWKTQSKRRVATPSWSKRRMIERLNRYIKPGTRVLEAGCGGGFFSNFFLGSGCEVTALDYSEDALELARQTTGGRAKGYVKADLLDPATGSRFAGQFDLIFTDGLLEHFTETQQRQILSNLEQSLAKDGVIVTFVPNRWSPWQWIRPFMMPGIEEYPFELENLRALHSSLDILESGGLNVLPIGPSPELLGPKLGMLVYVIGRKKRASD